MCVDIFQGVVPSMAILFALFSRIGQIFASYITTNSEVPFITGTNIYFMPLVYFIILGCVALIGYFCWQSYRQEIHEEKLQEKVAAKDENLSSNNLAWVNILVNWAFMSCAPDVPKAIERWMEDINFTLAKNQSTIKILVNGFQEGSFPPWLKMIGQPQKKQDNIEVPVFLDAEELGFTVSVQEEDQGKVITSTYTASISEFKCWYNITLSCKRGQDFLVKFELDTNHPYYIKINMNKQKSDHKITTTVPEVVADIIKIGVLSTPFYFNLSTWGPVNPTTQRARKPPRPEKKHKKDNNGCYAANSKTHKIISERGETAGNNVETTPKEKTPPAVASSPDSFLPPVVDDDSLIKKSNTLPSGTTRTLSDRLKSNQAQGLSGSLGSLVGIKRTPSGTGPAKPIRSREKRMIIKVLKTTGLSNDGFVFCRATLDFPLQKCRTKAVQSKSNMSWPEDKLTFDLSYRSSEVKLILKKKINGEVRQRQQESTIASAVLYLDRIDIDKPVEMSIPLRTAKKGNAEITVQLDFTENHDDQKFSSPRRSLDLSFVSDHLPPLAEKGKIESKSLASTMSLLSSDNNMSATGSTTVRTTTTKKSSPRRKSTGKGIPISHSAPNIKQKADHEPKSDVETIEGSVADAALKDLSEKAEIAKNSPQTISNIKKGKVVISAIGKANLEDDSFIEKHTVVNGIEEALVTDAKIERRDEMYYSTDSLHTAQGSGTTSLKVATSETETNVSEKGAVSTNPVARKPATKPKKSRRMDERPKSLVSGIKAEDLPGNGEDRAWPKVRRSRSLVLNKGKKNHRKTGSATDLHKHQIGKEGNVYEEESMVSIPENDLQKNSKKKKSKSITKLFSKLGRKPSTKKQRKGTDIQEADVEQSLLGDHSQISAAQTSGLSIEKHSLSTASPSSETPPNSYVGGSEGESSTLEMPNSSELSESTSLHSSINGDKGVKRSKSLRTRLFGGKRKSAKN